jgi:alkylation response protein AidB-like acyl-CoA dehydrogenase
VCGWHDLDLRDATGLGHGALVLGAAGAAVRDRWLSRLAAGDLVGIAATERHGGSRIQEITTRAALAAGGHWLISGEKVWVSRLAEADGLVVLTGGSAPRS